MACSIGKFRLQGKPDRQPVVWLFLLWLLVHVSPLPAQQSVLLLEEVAHGVFVRVGEHLELNQASIAKIHNAGFIVGEEAVLVIDPGGSVLAAKQLVDAVRAHTKLPIKHVVLSHFHPDHVAGAGVFGTDVNIIAHHRYPRALLQRSQFYTQRFALMAQHWARGRPTQLVDSVLRVDLGQRVLEITAHETAHTDNDLSVFDVNTGTLWASDLVFETRLPSLDGSLNGWLSVLQSLQQKQPSLVVPGHGNSGDWSATAGRQLDYLVGLRESVRRALINGLTLTETLALADSEPAGQWLLFAQQHPVNVTKAYTELEWE